METLCLNVLNCKMEISALLKGQKAITNSFNRYVLIIHSAPGAVLAAYNREPAGRMENSLPSWSLHSRGGGRQQIRQISKY